MDLGTTVYRNPTDAPVRLKFFVAPGQFVEFTIPPNGEAPIPSQFRDAIHRVRNGVVVGGHAPFLVREGQKETVAPTLAPEKPDKPGKR